MISIQKQISLENLYGIHLFIMIDASNHIVACHVVPSLYSLARNSMCGWPRSYFVISSGLVR